MEIRYNQRNFEEQLRELNQNLKELNYERDIYQKNFNIVKKNWSGDEYNKAEVEFIRMGNTLDKAIRDLTNQKKSLEERNSEFIRVNGGRV